MKKISFMAIVTLAALLYSSPVLAKNPIQEVRQEVKQEIKEAKQEVKEIRREAKKEIKEAKKELREDIREKQSSGPAGLLRKLFGERAEIGNATLSAKNGTSLTVTKDGKTYTVLTESKTQFRRRFWGKSSLDEMQTGDTVNVIGKWTKEANTTIQAILVRDLSIQKKFAVFVGTVQSLTGTGWVMQAVSRGTQTVTVSGTTKLVNRKEQAISQTDIALGHRVRVKGLWDKTSNTVTEVTHVKDYTLPVVTKTTPVPSAAPTSAPVI
ncbi:MAG: hypothetical protein UT63_C0083G0008 [Candidatus Gottesmanbacteria bacterium GW2011_GWC2_39_8]|uniref:DUF5666 domain-containing protein n=1 Tax=Candidatus Gottesmanbacteria bacterium GW2011_GWC2_39_8 TaxID=1618450 RepID=A0A0G0PT89_9BACT|nr:MAG: hypothetical protein UT63_C0083G0008 [Candidatus Gottesmanbacteria bacterium GW2011_GWC2_39_8]